MQKKSNATQKRSTPLLILVELVLCSGLAVMADLYPETILQRLLRDFQRGSSAPAPDKDHALEIRLKMGEVLMRASRAMGNHH